jgi:S1-C subfamily serine protease
MRHLIRAGIVLLAAAQALALAPARAADVDPAVLKAEAERVAVMERAKDSVLAIFAANGGGGGSGVVITRDGFALTNFHVTQPCGPGMKCGMADGKVYDAVIVGVDPVGDVALIKLFGRDDFPTAEIGDSDRLQPGSPVFAMGNPFLLATDFRPTATYGIVSGTHRYQFPSGTLLEYTDCIQTDASINPGNSGGPLFDAQGKLVGINGRASFEKRGRVNVGIAYAISINQIKNFLGCLKSGRVLDHATLGALVGFDSDNRVVVTDLIDTSDASRRGLRYGDELLAFGGRPIQTPNAFKNVLGIYPKGWRIPLSYRHEGKRQDTLVRLTGVHSEQELQKVLGGAKPPMPMPKPKPGENPGKPGEKPAKKPGREEDLPTPKPGDPTHGLTPAMPPLPEIVKKHFEEKSGFANYYFNRLNRERVWKALTARGDLTAKTWVLSGPLESGGRYELSIAERDIVLKLPNDQPKWTAGDSLAAALLPEGSGGMFPTLHLWRRLVHTGPEKFGDVWYYGEAPLAGHEGLADVLVGIHGGVESRFYFDPKAGVLLAIEMFPDSESDPCEIRFADYREVEGRQVPGRLEIRYGDEVFAKLKVEQFRLEK